MNLQQYLAAHRKGAFCLVCRKKGTAASYRRAEVPSHNHQDIWVWRAKRNGELRDNGTVEARIDRRTGRDEFNAISAADYEIMPGQED